MVSNSRLLSGTNALVELLLHQAEFDKMRGLRTGGFVSGYRGSPLGGLDQALWRRGSELKSRNIHFQPAINEDLAATALIGTQKVESEPGATVEGVFGLWYGKGPGVDRSGDALKHGNAYGTSPHGGVLVVAGDDHGCVSSSMSHQSDLAMQAWSMPVLHPVSVSDYFHTGLWGWAASRTSGAWIGFKAISETVESTSTVHPVDYPEFILPAIDSGPDGLHWRWLDLPGPQVEWRLKYKLNAIKAFAQTNPIDNLLVPVSKPRGLIIIVGKAGLDMLEALRVSGLSPLALAQRGIAILQLRLVFPLSSTTLSLAALAERVFIIEEKAAVVEAQLQHEFFNIPADRRPTIIGKRDSQGAPILPDDIELRPELLAGPMARWLESFGIDMPVPLHWSEPPRASIVDLPKRTPYFCPGCPHSSSTHVPSGSRARAGIGCHFMAVWMDRQTAGSVQMGGEGVDWMGTAPFTVTPHIFQNLGDGTYFHSGHLAIRQSVAAGVNITYKLLFNDAVAMTGGQPIDGQVTVPQIVKLALAEGVKKVAIVAEDISRYAARGELPAGVTAYHRDDLDAVQRELRDIEGVTVLIYDQVCATELRRRRKCDKSLQPTARAVINDLVCEGCGDCQTQSNCLAVVPIETSLGRKRAINQSACNTDLSCLKGFCPSFVTLEGATLAKRPVPAARDFDLDAAVTALAPPVPTKNHSSPTDILLVGIGGTGVVTAAGLIAQAARLDGNGVRTLNFTGFAQKGGEVLSHVRFCSDETALHQARIAQGEADLVLVADIVAGVSEKVLTVFSPERTRCIANLHESQTGPMLRNPDIRIGSNRLIDLLTSRSQRIDMIDAGQLAEALVGDREQANILLLGFSWQLGALPLTQLSIQQALDGLGRYASIARIAFQWGRLSAAIPAQIHDLLGQSGTRAKDLASLISSRRDFLIAYQDASYAQRYVERVEKIRNAAQALGDTSLTEAVAKNLFKLMAYKDEYEVARLHVETDFLASISDRFDGKTKIRFHFSPPLFAPKDRRTGERGKIAFGPWIIPVLRLLARGKFLRGTVFDLLGRQAERRAERQTLAEYEQHVDWIARILTAERLPLCRSLAALPEQIRGFGHVKQRSLNKGSTRRRELLQQIESSLRNEVPDTRPEFSRGRDAPENEKKLIGQRHAGCLTHLEFDATHLSTC
ncbi:indolepyruvate ferredoxin oxidoreductase family protein [Rhizobium leguminosarum]|nr:indolepyruvate ferredoxin oxidoreductase family protein [Rhizobium leguminosarum]NEJ25380.1 indolepyruvate ferredoxin oxidoreductase family protein [Rhizobium leguminosarum]NKL24593.1 indolepyruvate ferredoxin oxidoreductase family protein [Rhizobium leguminosarum bv. viciae]NKL59853.1 indolepyruvate ferredoxin oxidoreductase family protein [Rhizobium leguminosarum bv. viciae]